LAFMTHSLSQFYFSFPRRKGKAMSTT
jgi:hypothetical protein